MRRKRKAKGASLDSLLDTMTNVVGILVILLVVTQLGVKEAVKRIEDELQISEEDLAALKEKVSEKEASLQTLIERQKALQEGNVEAELAALQNQIQQTEQNIDAEAKKLLRKQQQLLQASKTEEARRKELQQQEESLRKELLAKQEEQARLQSLLAETPEQEKLPAHIVYLPNPRAAPAGAKPIYLICREGKLIFWDRENLRTKAQLRAIFLVESKKLARDPERGIDPDKLIPAFNASKIKDTSFQVKMIARGSTPYLVFERYKNAGEIIPTFQRPQSIFQRGLRTVSPEKFYLRYMVWPDSYDVYLEARKISSQYHFPAGWTLNSTTNELMLPLGGPIRFGPPPKPPINPPKPPAKPSAKPRPVDVID